MRAKQCILLVLITQRKQAVSQNKCFILLWGLTGKMLLTQYSPTLFTGSTRIFFFGMRTTLSNNWETDVP